MTKKDDLGPDFRPRHDLRILQALRRIIRSVELHSRQLAAKFKITGPQLICLLTVKEHQPVTATRIAKNIHVSPSTVVGILDRLEEKELIARERGTQDRRRVYVSLTAKGQKLASKAPSPLQDKFADALNALPELEQVTIALSLERIVDLMEVRQVDASPILEPGSKLDY